MPTTINAGRPFTRQQGWDLGLDDRRLGALVRAGELRRPLRGIYVCAATPDTRDFRITCLQLVMPDCGVVGGETAAWVYGIDAYSIADRTLLTPKLAVPHHRGRLRHSAVCVVERIVPAYAVTELDGLAITAPWWTALELARFCNRPTAMAALDAFAHAGLADPAALMDAALRLRGYPGIRQAKELIDLIEPRTESAGESWLRLRIVDAGFPRPSVQIRLMIDEREVYRLDLGYRRLKRAFEYDGMEFHEGREVHDAVRRRDIERRFGWSTYGFDRGAVLGRYPVCEIALGEILGQTPRLPRRW